MAHALDFSTKLFFNEKFTDRQMKFEVYILSGEHSLQLADLHILTTNRWHGGLFMLGNMNEVRIWH